MKYKKGTFVIMPNKDRLRGKPSPMQSIYFWLCEHANDSGGCYPSRKTLADEAGCDIKTLDKYLKELCDEGLVSIKQRKKGNELTSNYYQIMIVGVAPKTVQPYTENGVTGSPKNGIGTVSSINSNHLIAPANAGSEINSIFKEKELPPYEYKTELSKLSNSKWKPNKIIALFWSRKKWVFENKKQFDTAYNRQLRPARELEGYNSEQLTKAMDYCEDNFSKLNWGLETLIKVMPKVLNEL